MQVKGIDFTVQMFDFDHFIAYSDDFGITAEGSSEEELVTILERKIDNYKCFHCCPTILDNTTKEKNRIL